MAIAIVAMWHTLIATAIASGRPAGATSLGGDHCTYWPLAVAAVDCHRATVSSLRIGVISN